MQTIELESGKSIHVLDDLFSFEFRSEAYTFAKLVPLQMGWADTAITENQHHKYLHAPLTPADLGAFRMLDYLKHTPIAEITKGLRLEKTVLNVTVTSDAHFTHSHAEKKVVLYYLNQEWQDGWHGETLFFSENSKDIVFASRYVPGRVIVFDGSIPHSIRPQSRIAPQYRYTLAMVYDKCY
jgi:hypothetical protein